MRDNVSKVLERDQKLGELDERAENLNAASVTFARSSNKYVIHSVNKKVRIHFISFYFNRLKKKMWWENLKMKLIIGGVVLAVLFIIITIIIVETSGGGSESSSSNGSSGNVVVTNAESGNDNSDAENKGA